ncbi:SRPBCC family protein [Domibacillus enclensis]|uniref:Cell division protein n=1 Tax=Domibacillus enclensis TaxID=1017273 RepID=A0A1N6Y4C8_9BACI|nr:SRPBCC family protein [Domibacillus enclensis]OXS77513.1 cell division protein [Domibacillus enclensis]SIR09482.1 hypothetical protein SAMN05443094_105148 [Domibacillus enclensis]
MPVINHEIYIHAPIHTCFDLARSVDAHVESTKQTNERAVGGKTSGLMEKGDHVTWEATHFGIRQQLTANITEMNPPYHFTDVMVKGTFHSFTHEHYFTETNGVTVMKDRFDYKSPLGIIGKIADRLFLQKYMERFIAVRAKEIKRMAEKSRQ